MNTKKTIGKILVIALWLSIGAGMITLFAAAMRKQKKERCKDYVINIKGAERNLFVDNQDIYKLVSAATRGNVKGQPRSVFNLRQLEQLIEDNVWIRDAELYFDNNQVLHITVQEREPVARIFTTAGKTFYIDREEMRMPLSDKLSADVPVFTGFPEKKKLTKADSTLLHSVHEIATYIAKRPFWTAQVAQVDITPDRRFEMVPVVGNHIVKLGDGEDIERKFNRLFIFYKKVLSKTGFDKYRTIDVQYNGQVVGTKGYATKIDSVQLRRAVEKLLQQARDMQYDTAMVIKPVAADPELSAEIKGDDEDAVTAPVTPVEGTPAATLPPTPPKQAAAQQPKRTQPASQRQQAPTQRQQPANRTPKAVMPKSTDREREYEVQNR